jgi:hypothetical protein
VSITLAYWWTTGILLMSCCHICSSSEVLFVVFQVDELLTELSTYTKEDDQARCLTKIAKRFEFENKFFEAFNQRVFLADYA